MVPLGRPAHGHGARLESRAWQVPFDLIIYAVPIWMRLPLNHGISLAWTMILARSKKITYCMALRL